MIMVKPVLPLIHEQNKFSFVQNNVFSNGTIVKTQTTFELNELVSTFQTGWKLSQIFTSIIFIDNTAEKWPNTLSSSAQISRYLNEFFLCFQK